MDLRIAQIEIRYLAGLSRVDADPHLKGQNASASPNGNGIGPELDGPVSSLGLTLSSSRFHDARHGDHRFPGYTLNGVVVENDLSNAAQSSDLGI